MVRFFAVGLGAFLLAACAVIPTGAPSGLAGQRLEAQQTLSAIDRQLAAATEAAGATQAAHAFSVTATADALQAAQAQSAATATAGAQRLAATQTARAAEFSAHATQDAYSAAQSAQALQATQARQTATRSERAQDLTATLVPLFALTLLVGLIAAAILGLVALANYLAAIDRRRSVVETRTGTILLLATPAGLVAQVLARPTPLPDGGDDEWVSEAERAEPIPVYSHGALQTVLERGSAPDDPDRRLMLRLLRAAMLAVGPDSPRLPGFRELGWPAETWTKAVALLKPHVVTKPGRSGGTFTEGGATLRDLYNAVGERRIIPLPQLESADDLRQNVR